MIFFRRKGIQPAIPRPVLDPALPDSELVAVRDLALRGQWRPARDLLAATGKNWARRSHIVWALADTAEHGLDWMDAWLAAEPDNGDAVLVRGRGGISHAWAARGTAWAKDTPAERFRVFFERLHETEPYCWRAAEMLSADPTPWATLLLLGRALQVEKEEFWARWSELVARDPYHFEGHKQALHYLAPKWFGSDEEMFDFALRAAADAPAGSPLATLPLDAHVEYTLYHHRDHGPQGLMKMIGHWESPPARVHVDHAVGQLRLRAGRRDVETMTARNVLAYALFMTDRWPEAREQFEEIGPYVTQLPWAYFYEDPVEGFLDARKEAFAKSRRRR